MTISRDKPHEEYWINLKKKFKIYYDGRNNQYTPVLSLKLLRLIPTFEVLSKSITIQEIFPEFSIEEELAKRGLSFDSASINMRIENVLLILKYLFPEFDILDCQGYRSEPGHPDFKLKEKGGSKHEIYIEIKKNGDGIHRNQIDWLFNNTDKEVYFLFLKENYPYHY